MESTLWMPIAVYVPALTFNQGVSYPLSWASLMSADYQLGLSLCAFLGPRIAIYGPALTAACSLFLTGIDVHVITPIVCAICTFYTCVGGIKAVVLTDFFQSFVMFGTVFLVMIKGTIDVGGFGVVWQRNMDSGRLEFPELTLDPTVRMSMLGIFIGGTIYRIQNTAIAQPAVQRFVSLPSLNKIKQTLTWSCIGLTFLLTSCAYVGLVTYATYYDCDPMTTKLAKARDQLVPLLVMDVLGKYPGLAGLFVSAVFSAALSSLSTVLNSLSAVVLEDFAKPFSRHSLSERHTAILMRLVVVVFGIASIGMVYVVEKLGMVLQLSATVQAISQGPMLGIFIVGICMPWVNTKSVLTGSITALVIMAWICIKGQIATLTKEFVVPEKPVSVEGCNYAFVPMPIQNSTLNDAPTAGSAIHHMSWLWYGALGAFLTVVVSNLAIFVFGRNKVEDMDIELMSPFLQKYYRAKKYESVQMSEKAEEAEKQPHI